MAYPKMLYREGSGRPWDGRPTDRLVVRSADDEDRALAAGWKDANGYWAEAESAKSLLDNNAKVIEAALPSLSLEELEKLKADEITGKTRKGVMAMLQAAIDERRG